MCVRKILLSCSWDRRENGGGDVLGRAGEEVGGLGKGKVEVGDVVRGVEGHDLVVDDLRKV